MNDDFDDAGITNLDRKDAFEEAFTSAGLQVEKVHIRVQQRNRRKCVCSVTGLADDLDLQRILKALKKSFKCNGSVALSPNARRARMCSRPNEKG